MPIVTTIENKVAQIAIQRPERRNTLDTEMCTELSKHIRESEKDEKVRVLMLTGESNVFCAGLDIDEMMKNPHPLFEAFKDVINALDECTKPIVVAVAGPAVAQGAVILYHCDLVYCGEHALFSLPDVALGLCPQLGTGLFAVKNGGYKRAMQKILLCEPMNPHEAATLGIVTGVVPDDKLMQQATAVSSRLTTLPQKAVLATKEILKAANFRGIKEQSELEQNVFKELFNAEESREAMQAFLEKRTPKFD
ncbi:MAG: enoyl-CoA hydratase-related protein [Burkholderiales bacterium]|nr:enoyl-CoA hydratase-related protein [Burkholderiales bacterium]